MITETTYSHLDIEKGKCKSCGEKSNEILIDDGRCVDYIESDKFYEETMKDSDRYSKNREHFDPSELW